ncbi:MAG TPA: fumarylacetoacetate hydrolase family protein [Bryobacteraceae bacterium]|nr:fumarylacetoacetate hydrolase family protein [Bryobacteraceae bacterium]
MILYRTRAGWELHRGSQGRILLRTEAARHLTTREDLYDYLLHAEGEAAAGDAQLLAPIEDQEIWAAGVTYYRSRTARMAESQAAGGMNFYDRVYHAERPELFFKGTPHRVSGPGKPVRIRRDSKWNVPEPELSLLVSPGGRITGYTIGNDMSSRDIEGENPLYLPQAKVYDRSCALGPGILVTQEPLPTSTAIRIDIRRGGASLFSDGTTLAEMKRRPEELVEYLYRENTFPNGCFLLTGTGIVPPESFTLLSGDEIEIAIDGIGMLRNTAE